MVFTAKKYLITSEMLCFYKKIGLDISNLTLAIEYRKGYPLKPFITQMTNKRIEATISKEKQKQNLYKLTVNSSYGRTGKNDFQIFGFFIFLIGLNVSKHVSVKYGNEKNLAKKTKTPFFKYFQLIASNKNGAVYEIISGKRRQTDRVPVQVAFTILQHAKQHVLEFFNMVRLHADLDALKICYMGK